MSKPESCDGWLGIMIGDALWYPLWEDGMVQKTCDSLIPLLGGDAKISGSVIVSPSASPSAVAFVNSKKKIVIDMMQSVGMKYRNSK